MNKQISFSDIEYAGKKKKTRRELMLEKMDSLIPWKRITALVEPVYFDGHRGRPPIGIERMLRMYIVQILFSLSDEGTEDSLYDSGSIRKFCMVDLCEVTAVPDATTLLNFRHLLEEHKMTEKIFKLINKDLEREGLLLRKGTIVDATIIAAPSSTKNENKSRDPEMHQTKKGNNWYFGMKAHVGADADSGLVHTLEATSANVHDVTMTGKLLHGDEELVYGDAGYTGAPDREEIKGCEHRSKIKWRVARKRGKIRKMPEGNKKDRLMKAEKLKASVRAKVEYNFHVIKNVFGFKKVCYRGIAKNLARLYALFACSNLLIAARMKDGAKPVLSPS